MNLNPNRFVQWLIDHSPVFCVACNGAVFKKDAIYEQSNLGIWVPLCQTCRDEIYEPLRTANKNRTCWYLDDKCPECGIGLVTNGTDVWCGNPKCKKS